MSRAPYCTINVSNLQSLCTSLLDEVLQIEEDVKLEVTAVLDRNPAEATFLDDATTPQRLVTAHVDISSIVENEKNGSRESVITSRLTAVANGSVLTLFSNAPSNEDDEEEKDPLSSNDVIAELEFDNNIEAVGWSGGGACVIVGDCAGMLHFVTRQGELVFSHRIVPGACNFVDFILQSYEYTCKYSIFLLFFFESHSYSHLCPAFFMLINSQLQRILYNSHDGSFLRLHWICKSPLILIRCTRRTDTHHNSQQWSDRRHCKITCIFGLRHGVCATTGPCSGSVEINFSQMFDSFYIFRVATSPA